MSLYFENCEKDNKLKASTVNLPSFNHNEVGYLENIAVAFYDCWQKGSTLHGNNCATFKSQIFVYSDFKRCGKFVRCKTRIIQFFLICAGLILSDRFNSLLNVMLHTDAKVYCRQYNLFPCG